MNAYRAPILRIFLIAVSCLSLFTSTAFSQIAAPELAALRPLMCGSCFHVADLKIYEPNAFDPVQPGLFVTAGLKNPLGRQALLPDVQSEAGQGRLALASKDPMKRAYTRHVCLGLRVPVSSRSIGVDAKPPYAGFTKVDSHPDAVDGVCDGELRSIEAFLQGIVASLFADQFAKAEKRTAPEAINEALRNNLADVLAQHKTELAQQIKREVVADLRPKDGAAAASDPAAIEPQLASCKTGTFSCPGNKPYATCCMCAGGAGQPARHGICDASGTVGSWRPAP